MILSIIFIVKDGYKTAAIVFTLIPGVLYFAPTFVIWIQYLSNDYKKALSIDKGVYSYFDFRTLEKFSFTKEDILEVRIIKRNISGDIGLPWFPWHYFSYTEITLNNKKIIRFSFLTLPENISFDKSPKIVSKPLPYIN
jgi:hypothetical protein